MPLRPMPERAFRGMVWLYKVQDLFSAPRGKLARLGLQPGQTVMDYGCGPGRYVLEASRLVGPKGKIYAVDIHPLAIKAVRDLLRREGLANVEAVLARGYATGLPSHLADVIYALDMFHGVSEPAQLQREWLRLLKPGGLLYLEDGHQPRAETLRKVREPGLFRVESQAKHHIVCRPALEEAP